IAVVRHFVGLTGREVEAARDLLVEEDVAHGLLDLRIEANGKLADVAGALVGVEDFVDGLGVVGRRLVDLALTELEFDVVGGDTLVDRGGVVADDALYRIPHRGGETSPVWDVVGATAGNGRNALHRKAQVRSRAGDVNL